MEKEVLFEAIANLQVIIDESGATITHDHLPRVMFDDVQMTQLFQNLISNAIKFRSKETPYINISAKKVKNSKFPLPKSESGNQKSKSWLFSVQDNGIGIDPKFKDRIFTIFQRLHPREKYPGVGIGLTICERIVNRHGGRIWVESKTGKGSTFYFTIPIRNKR